MRKVSPPLGHGQVFLIAFLTLLMLGPVRAQDQAKIEIVPVVGHSAPVLSVAFSPDGARVHSGSQDETIKLWDVATGALIRIFKGHSDWVHSVAFSPNGAHVLSGSDDTTIKLWDAATGALIRTFEGHSDWVHAVAFSPDGARVLPGSWDATIRVWDPSSGELRVILIATRAGEWLAITPEGFLPPRPMVPKSSLSSEALRY